MSSDNARLAWMDLSEKEKQLLRAQIYQAADGMPQDLVADNVWKVLMSVFQARAAVRRLTAREMKRSGITAKDKRWLRKRLDDLDRFFSKRIAWEQIARRAAVTIALGRTVEKTTERAASTRRRVRAGGVKGQEVTYGTAEAKRRRWEEYQLYLDRQHTLHPEWKFRILVIDAAIHFKVNQRTIKRHAINPIKR